MANWCTTFATIYQNLKVGKPDQRVMLDRVYAMLVAAKRTAGSDLYEIVKAINGSEVEIPDVGTVNKIELIQSQGKDFWGIQLDIESKWNPPEYFLDALQQAITEMPHNDDMEWSTVFLADEPGNGIFINTDKNHHFYTEVLGIDWQINDDKEGACDHTYFTYKEFDEAANLIKDCTGVVVTSFEDIAERSDYICEKFEEMHPEDGSYFFIEPYTCD